MLIEGHEAGCAEENIEIEIFQISFTQLQPGSQRFQLRGLFSHLITASSVAGGDGAAGLKQMTNQRIVTHTDADDADFFAFQAFCIFMKCHARPRFLKCI